MQWLCISNSDNTSVKSLVGSGDFGGTSKPAGSSKGSSSTTVCVILNIKIINVHWWMFVSVNV